MPVYKTPKRPVNKAAALAIAKRPKGFRGDTPKTSRRKWNSPEALEAEAEDAKSPEQKKRILQHAKRVAKKRK
jgi:hypothetical protein